MDAPPPITGLLRSWRAGDDEAGQQLMAHAYRDLRRLAAAQLRGERPGHTLQPTALVHELYLRLFSGETPAWEDRAHFLATAARQLRHLVIDHARRRNARKRGGPNARADVDLLGLPGVPVDGRVLDLDEALRALERLEPRAASVVELRFFGGLGETEIGAALGISAATVRRDWTFARSWLKVRLAGADPA
ncbi:MAG: sigma-70 family RNA polymerase sigma factor [Vicinamibacteria bacterium]